MAIVSVNYDLNTKKLKTKELVKPIVFVVDMVNGFVKEGAMADPSINEISSDIKTLLNRVKPSIFICDAHDLDAKEFDSFPVHCVQNTFESEVIDELKDQVKTKFYKNSTNAFVNEKIRSFIDDNINNYRDFVIVGCCSDICVLQFALSLNTYFNELDLKDNQVIVPINMVETYNASYHNQIKYNEFALSLMQQSGIMIVELGD